MQLEKMTQYIHQCANRWDEHFKIDSSFPLLKSNNTIKETLTPKISLRINPGNNMDNYSSTSQI